MSPNSQANSGSNHANYHISSITNGNNNYIGGQLSNHTWSKYHWPSSTCNLKTSIGVDNNSDQGLILGQNDVALGLTSQIGGLCGLFEVEPLHFSLHTASDGTTMERIFPGNYYLQTHYLVPLFVSACIIATYE